MNAAASLEVQVLITFVNRQLPADGGAGDDRRLLAQSGGERDSRIPHRFPRGHDGKLRKTVDLGVFPALEMRQRIEAAHFCAILKTEGGTEVRGFDPLAHFEG